MVSDYFWISKTQYACRNGKVQKGPYETLVRKILVLRYWKFSLFLHFFLAEKNIFLQKKTFLLQKNIFVWCMGGSDLSGRHVKFELQLTLFWWFFVPNSWIFSVSLLLQKLQKSLRNGGFCDGFGQKKYDFRQK